MVVKTPAAWRRPVSLRVRAGASSSMNWPLGEAVDMGGILFTTETRRHGEEDEDRGGGTSQLGEFGFGLGELIRCLLHQVGWGLLGVGFIGEPAFEGVDQLREVGSALLHDGVVAALGLGREA